MELAIGNEAAVQARVRALGWIGEDERVLGLASAGEGNMNVTLRARLPHRTLILKQARPYVVKYPQIPAPLERLASEAAFYRAIAGSDALRRHTPALLGEDRDDHLLCLEDLGDGRDLTRLYAAADGEADRTLRDLTRWLGQLHSLEAQYLDVPANHAMRALNHTHIFEVPFDPAAGPPLTPPLRHLRESLAADPKVRDEAHRLGELYLGRASHRSRAVLLHGDFYPGSWLMTDRARVAVIDPEFCFVGPPEFDVGVLEAHLIMAGMDADAVAQAMSGYPPPRGFDAALARRFAAMEVIRRLLGVAQLPLTADDDTRCRWLHQAWERLRS